MRLPIGSEVKFNIQGPVILHTDLWVNGNCACLAFQVHHFDEDGGLSVEDVGVAVHCTLIQPYSCDAAVLAPIMIVTFRLGYVKILTICRCMGLR